MASRGGGRRQKILMGALGVLALVFVVRMMGGGGGDGGESSSDTQPGGPSATVVAPDTPTTIDIVPAPDLSGVPPRNPFEPAASGGANAATGASASTLAPTDPTSSGRPADTGAA